MMAIWRGTAAVRGIAMVELEIATACALDRHQVGFFGSQRLVDLGDMTVGQFLHVVLRAALIVLGDFLLS